MTRYPLSVAPGIVKPSPVPWIPRRSGAERQGYRSKRTVVELGRRHSRQRTPPLHDPRCWQRDTRRYELRSLPPLHRVRRRPPRPQVPSGNYPKAQNAPCAAVQPYKAKEAHRVVSVPDAFGYASRAGTSCRSSARAARGVWPDRRGRLVAGHLGRHAALHLGGHTCVA